MLACAETLLKKINQLIAKRLDESMVMYHWYQTGGLTILATGFQQNIQRFLGMILSNRNDGAYVQVTVASTETNLEEAARARRCQTA